jgi:hypothetical protein
MSGAAFMRLEKLKGGGIWSKAARHNRRTIQAELGASGHIDATRSHLNITLMGPATPEEVARLAKAKMTEAGITKDRKNGVLGVELVFSLPTNHELDVIEYFTDCAHWAGAAFGGLNNIISVDIHRDEAQDHAHVLLVPLIDGRLRGSDAIGGKRNMSELQAKFYKDVASGFGFSKPRSKLSGHHKAHITRQVLEKLRFDPAAKSAAWAVIRDSVKLDPMPYALALDIDTTTPAKPSKTMTQIFTSTGKGREKENPIGKHTIKPYKVSAPSAPSAPSEPQTLGHCRVSISPPPPKAPPANADRSGSSLKTKQHDPENLRRQVANAIQTVRIRDFDLPAESYDPETGEFYRRPASSG